MTLYKRPRAEVFADNAPPSEIQPFQAWLRGLGIAFDETNGLPEMTGLNGLFNALNQYIKYLEQNGFAEWSSTLEYPIGAGVRVGSIWYRAKTRNTNKPPATSQNDWAVFLNGADVASASTTVKGIVQLSNVLNSTSTTQALTAAQGKKLQDEKLDKSGGTLTGDVILSGAGKLINLGAANTNSIRTRGIQGIKTDNSAPDGLYLNQEGGAVYFGENQFSINDNGDFSGNAASATKLATARTIGGVSFNGTSNINLPGVNISGNQNTSGTAANCSRSIVAGNGLSGGGDLTANRTLTLGTPSTVTASTTNSTTGTSHTHNLDVNSLPLLGVGQTWQDVTGSRARGSTYTNSTGRPIQLSIAVRDTSSASSVTLTIGGVIVLRLADISGSDAGYQQITAIVPNGQSYRLDTANTLSHWAELR